MKNKPQNSNDDLRPPIITKMRWKKWFIGMTLWGLSLIWFGFQTSPFAAGALAGVTAGAIIATEAET